MAVRLAPLASILALTACMPQGDFPSLAKRPIETSFDQPPVPAPAATTELDAAALARVSAALDAARKSVAPFEAALAAARPVVAASANAPQGSDRWIDGQVAASRLEPLLGPATTALADLEEELRQAISVSSPADRAAIEAAIAETSDIVARQAEGVKLLTEQLDR